MSESASGNTKGTAALPRVLFVDDDTDLLETIEAQLGTLFEVATASSGTLALTKIKTERPFAVIVSDMEMAGMNGIEFLKRARQVTPESVRVMMTARSEIGVASGAVNDGHVFRFLVKPYRSAEMQAAIDQCVNQYRLVTAERELLETTLINSIQMLIDILALASPLAFGRANRIRSYARQMADILRISPVWEVELAGLLCQIGCITIPPPTLAKVLSGDTLSADESDCCDRLYQVSASLIDHIPRLERVSRIIGRLTDRASQTGSTESNDGFSHESTLAGILRVALDFDALVSRGLSKSRAVADMQKRPKQYDSYLIETLSGVDVISADRRMTVVKCVDLNSTMVVRENLYAKNGHLIVGKNQQVTKSMRELIKSYVQRGILEDAISVYLPADSANVKAIEIVSDSIFPNQAKSLSWWSR